MTLKYENEQTEMERAGQTSPISPLYGDEYMPQPTRARNDRTAEQPPDVMMLREPDVIEALKYAEKVYSKELMRLGYSPITIGSYSSSVGRFIQFLEFGRVIPDREQ
jgi:hypothetical protein